MTDLELKEIEARFPKGADRSAVDRDASQLAAEVRSAWSEGVALRQGLADTRNTGARLSDERAAAGALADRYKVERDALVERCSSLRKTLAELLSGLQSGPGRELELSALMSRARSLLDAAP